MLKKIFCLFLCLLLLTLSLPVSAAERTLSISSAEELLAFAEDCRLDSFSKGLSVTIEKDIDLGGKTFTSVPFFGGRFDGKGHRISGITLKSAGSTVGFFRYIDEGATVENLTLDVTVTPTGSKQTVGGLAGENRGSVKNCELSGTVRGSAYVGGLAGINREKGIIEDSSSKVTVSGRHFVGGIAGENLGVIRGCKSSSAVNTTPADNTVSISDIDIENLTGNESAASSTDIGGIAGGNSGVIRDCENSGQVGYRQMGYNVGGIAGSHMGYIVDCENRGAVFGRKDVGGIAGQIEPAAAIDFSEDTLQKLEKKLSEIDRKTHSVKENLLTVSDEISAELEKISDEIETMRSAINELLPEDEITLDPDRLIAARNAVSSGLTAVYDSAKKVYEAGKKGSEQLQEELKELYSLAEDMVELMRTAESSLGASVSDVSDSDTREETVGEIEKSKNSGKISADLNVGGITGTAAFENDLDPEEDPAVSGESSLYFSYSVRAVITECENLGEISAKKQAAGGIVGYMRLGLARSCKNSGKVSAADADLAGGIAGDSQGKIRDCFAKCRIEADSFAGGIAGRGQTVTDCRAMTLITANERLGGILGFADSLDEIKGNFYLVTDTDLGGIDGVSYDKIARPLDQKEFFALKSLPDMFSVITVRFVFDDGKVTELKTDFGGALNKKDFPVLPERKGFVSKWAGADGADFSHLTFDVTLTAEYTPKKSTLASAETRKDGRPVLLAEGSFADGARLRLDKLGKVRLGEDTSFVLEGYEVDLPEGADGKVRFLPDGAPADRVEVWLRNGEGWRRAELSVSGSYLLFTLSEGDSAFCVTTKPDYLWLMVALIGGGILLLAAGVTVFVCVRKTKKKKARKAEEISEISREN